MQLTETSEAARSMGENVAHRLRGGTGAAALRRLGAEIEMWLHDHPVNDARKARGELPVTGFWLWGGGPLLSPSLSSGNLSGNGSEANAIDLAFGSDAYVQGLWTTIGAKALPLPEQLMDVFGYPHAQRAVLLVEIGDMLHSNSRWTLFDALEEIDRRFMAPAVEALRQGRIQRLDVLANDRQLTLRPRDRFKFWRRPLPGLSGLQ